MKLKNGNYRIMLGMALVSWALVWGAGASAESAVVPQQLVDDYLQSLSAGDTQRLSTLVEGSMKANNRQLELSPDTYSRFLQDHYKGVQMTVEDLSATDSGMLARVRFDYPNSDSSVIEFVLTQVDGQWKITDEKF